MGQLFPCSPWGSRAELNFCLISIHHCICFYCLTVQVQAPFFNSNSYSALHNRQEEEFGSLDGCCCSKNCCIPILGAGRRGSAYQARPVHSPPAGPCALDSYTLHKVTQKQQLPSLPPCLFPSYAECCYSHPERLSN